MNKDLIDVTVEEIQVELGAMSDVNANVNNPRGRFIK